MKYSISIPCFLFAASLCWHGANATSCDTDCSNKCKRCWSISLGFRTYKDCKVEPACYATCNSEKALSCGLGYDLELTPDVGTFVCGLPVEVWTSGVVAQCANDAGRGGERQRIDDAIAVLDYLGVYPKSNFESLDIRWCNLAGLATGITPDESRILLSKKMLNSHPTRLAALLAHEYKHIEQYEADGEFKFNCNLSQDFFSSGYVQENTRYEMEAYEFEYQVEKLIEESTLPGNLFKGYYGPPPSAYVVIQSQR